MRASLVVLIPISILAVSCGGSSRMAIVHTGLPNDGATIARLSAGGARYGCLTSSNPSQLILECAAGKVTFISGEDGLIAGCEGSIKGDCRSFVNNVLAAGGPGAPLGPTAGPAEPDASLRPAGSGWHCFPVSASPDSGAGVRICERTYPDCDKMRLEFLKKYPGTGECNPQATAYCYSSITDSGMTLLTCLGTQMDCTQFRKSSKSPSGCVAWN